MIRHLLALLCVVAIPATIAATREAEAPRISAVDEDAEREAILARVRGAIAASDYAALSAMADDFRATRSRTPSGVWKLAVLHAGLQFYLRDGLRPEEGCQYRQEDFVRHWAAASPQNPAPIITDAALRKEQAWCIRGAGYRDKVGTDAWPRFYATLATARERLDRGEGGAAIDPEFYAVQIEILGSLGAEKERLRQAVDAAARREPAYVRTYAMAAWHHLPRWGGGDRDLEQFVRYAAEKARAEEGDGLYARIFWTLDERERGIIAQADRTVLLAGMRDVARRYPTAWNVEYFADLACRLGDKGEGRRYLRAMHPETTDDASFVALFDACDMAAM